MSLSLAAIFLLTAAALLFAGAFVYAAGPTVTTDIHNGSHAIITSAPVGSQVHDRVVVASSSGPIPTGTVDFNLYSNTTCSGTPVVQSAVALLNGIAESATTTVRGFRPLVPCALQRRCNKSPSDGVCEALTATGANISITTDTLNNDLGLGGISVHDSATLLNETANAGGTVAYTVFSNNSCSADAQSAGTKTVTNGTVPNSNSIQFNSAGTFYWQAVYSGDTNNTAATSSCQSEVLTVVATSTPLGRIIVDKITNPSSATTTFNFVTNGTGYASFDLTDSSAPNSQALPPGVYRVWESSKPGWKLTSARCSLNGATSTTYTGNNLNLGSNDTITCTFTNTKKATSTDIGDNGKHKGFFKGLPFGIWKKLFNDDFPIIRTASEALLGR